MSTEFSIDTITADSSTAIAVADVRSTFASALSLLPDAAKDEEVLRAVIANYGAELLFSLPKLNGEAFEDVIAVRFTTETEDGERDQFLVFLERNREAETITVVSDEDVDDQIRRFALAFVDTLTNLRDEEAIVSALHADVH